MLTTVPVIDVAPFLTSPAGGRRAVVREVGRACEEITPTLWDGDPRVVQVLFPGAHSDVGGGYPQHDGQSGLSDGGLQWMMARLAGLQVTFAAAPVFPPRPDPCGVTHRPWIQPPWNVLPKTPRVFRPGLALHGSVVDGLKCAPAGTGSASYNPQNLSEYIAAGQAKAAVTVV